MERLTEGKESFSAPFIDTAVFNTWIKDFLLPTIKNKKKIIIMDNVSFHKSQETRRIIEEGEHKLLYLPPYSPDFNPIEKRWSHIKNKVKSIKDHFANFFDCLDYVLCC